MRPRAQLQQLDQIAGLRQILQPRRLCLWRAERIVEPAGVSGQTLMHGLEQPATPRACPGLPAPPGPRAHRGGHHDAPLFASQLHEVVVQQSGQPFAERRAFFLRQQGLQQATGQGAQDIEQDFGQRRLPGGGCQRQPQGAGQPGLVHMAVQGARHGELVQIAFGDRVGTDPRQPSLQLGHIDFAAQLARHQHDGPGHAAEFGQQGVEHFRRRLLPRQPGPGGGDEHAAGFFGIEQRQLAREKSGGTRRVRRCQGVAAGDDGAKLGTRGAQAGQQSQQVGANGGFGQQVFGVIQHEQPLAAGQRTEERAVVVERTFGHEQSQGLPQMRQVGLAAEVDESHVFAGAAPLVGHRQRQLGFARTGQPFEHHDGVPGQVFGQSFQALLVVHIMTGARGQLRQPPERTGAQRYRHERRQISHQGRCRRRRRRTQEKHRTRPGQAVGIQFGAGPGKCRLQITAGMAPGFEQVGGELGDRGGVQGSERGQDDGDVAVIGVEQRLGHAHIQRPERAGAVTAPQQRDIDLPLPYGGGEIGGGDDFAGVGRVLGAVAVVQHQPAAADHAMAHPDEDVRPMLRQAIAQRSSARPGQGGQAFDHVLLGQGLNGAIMRCE